MSQFEIRRTDGGQYWFRFVASNGQIICWSETYTAKQNAIQAAQLVQGEARSAAIHDMTGETPRA